MNLELPSLWLGHSTDTSSPLSEHRSLKSSASLFSYGDAIRRPELRRKFIGRIGEKMGFSGPVMIDSGGFTISRIPSLKFDPLQLRSVFEELEADLFVSLDFPPWRDDCKETRKSKIRNSAESYRVMSDADISGPLMPVIHGRELDEIDLSCDLTTKAGFTGGPLGIGGLVPLIQSSGASHQARRFIVDAIRKVRDRFPASHLHIFGAGSPNTIRALLLAGADSADSIAWRQAAAYGSIYLPGTAQRLITWKKPTRPPRPILNDFERELLAACLCPACRQLDPNSKADKLGKSFRLRSVHNAYVIKASFEKRPLATDLPTSWTNVLAERMTLKVE